VVAGARVHGIVASPQSIPSQEWRDPEFYVKARLDEKYINVDPESDRFLTIDRANFRIWRRDIVGIEFYPKKWGMGAVPYSGRIIVRTRDGRGHELILLGEQDASAIRERLL
jgi:hypothetical protein